VVDTGGNVDGVGTSWSVILGVLLVTVVVHGQKACDIHRKVSNVRGALVVRRFAPGETKEKKRSTDGQSV
jgi:hypothetical protein